MKLSTRTRYGTRLMLELGIHYDQGPIFLKDIAKLEDISEKYLSQIIIPLKNSGLVNSFRGAHGGYVLAKPPNKISMRSIIEVLEGNLSLVDCVKKPSLCSRVSMCTTRSLWGLLSDKVGEVLQEMTLLDLVNQCKNKKSHVINYCI
ncbi:MAG: Rrf2 family transcriptional regulator [Candidatus Omnitrophota bacterium]